jgi:four helix bundle protein
MSLSGAEVAMLRVYRRYVEWLPGLVPVLERLERRDVNLHHQLRDACESVALNLNEGSGNEGGTRRQRYLSALGSARETMACLEVAQALGYLQPPRELLSTLSGIIGTLVVLVRGRS